MLLLVILASRHEAPGVKKMDMYQSMAHRDLTTKFNDYRRGISSVVPNHENPWIRHHQAVGAALADLSRTISKIEAQRRRNRRVVFDSIEEEKQLTEALRHARAVTAAFGEIHQSIYHLDQFTATVTPPDAVVVRNAVAAHRKTIQDLFVRFRQGQQEFTNFIDLQIGHESQEQNPSFQSQEQDSFGHEFLHQRSQAIEHLVSQIRDLHEIMQELNSMVLDQGNILDQIEVHTINALEDVKKANDQELQPIVRRYSRPWSCYCALGMLLLVIIMTIVVIVKYQNK